MKDYYKDLKDLQCLYKTHDFMEDVIKLKGVSANVKPSEIMKCFEENKLPTKYMNCKL